MVPMNISSGGPDFTVKFEIILEINQSRFGTIIGTWYKTAQILY